MDVLMIFLSRNEQRVVQLFVALLILGLPLQQVFDTWPAVRSRISFFDQVDVPRIWDINTITFDELVEIPGVGRTTAERIIRYRTEVGKFQQVEELVNIPGISAKKFQFIVPHFSVGGQGK